MKKEKQVPFPSVEDISILCLLGPIAYTIRILITSPSPTPSEKISSTG